MDLITLYWLTPEIIITTIAIVCLLLGLVKTELSSNIAYSICQLGFLANMVIIYEFLAVLNLQDGPLKLATDTIIIDHFSLVLKLIISTLGFLIFLYAKEYINSDRESEGEFYSLALFSILGMMVLVSSNSFLTLYLGIELLSLPLYALIALNKKRERATEAGMKYFIMGGVASSIMLFGISLIYVVSGGLSLSGVSGDSFSTVYQMYYKAPFIVGVVCLWLGIAFKLGAAPFHSWVPDVYEGAPVALTMFISSLPKIAAFGIVYRIVSNAFGELGDGIYNLVLVTAVLSILIGTLSALFQDNIKRLLAYSAIANIGYILLGVLVGAFQPALFYLVLYSIMVIGVFGILLSFSSDSEVETFSDLSGFAKKYPVMGMALMFLVLSMAGLPPFAGFYAKLILLQALLVQGKVSLVIFGLIMSVIGAFYYLRIVKVLYFNKRQDAPLASVKPSSQAGQVMLAFNGFIALLLGIYPVPIMELCSLIG